jgi:hypothetical protein
LRERKERPSIQPLKADLHQRFDVRSIRPLAVRRVDEAVWPLHGVEDIPLDIKRCFAPFGRRGLMVLKSLPDMWGLPAVRNVAGTEASHTGR